MAKTKRTKVVALPPYAVFVKHVHAELSKWGFAPVLSDEETEILRHHDAQGVTVFSAKTAAIDAAAIINARIGRFKEAERLLAEEARLERQLKEIRARIKGKKNLAANDPDRARIRYETAPTDSPDQVRVPVADPVPLKRPARNYGETPK